MSLFWLFICQKKQESLVKVANKAANLTHHGITTQDGTGLGGQHTSHSGYNSNFLMFETKFLSKSYTLYI